MGEGCTINAQSRRAFAELVVRHLEGELDGAGRGELNAKLAAAAEWRELFASLVIQARFISARLGPDLTVENGIVGPRRRGGAEWRRCWW